MPLPHVAFIGLGLMGEEMCRRLVEQNYPVFVWTRTTEKAEEFVKTHPPAKAARTVSEAIAAAKYVVLMLNDYAAIRSTLCTDEALSRLSGKTVVMMMTIATGESVELAGVVHSHGGSYVECPVLGSKPVAASGQLVLLPSAPAEVLTDELRALLQVFGDKWRPISDQYGKSLVVKLALNQSVVAQIATLANSLALVKGHGVSTQLFWDILQPSVAHAKYFDIKFDRMNKGNHDDPVFSVRNLLKDASLISKELQNLGFDNSGVDGTRALIEHTVQSGYGDSDASAVIEGVMRHHKQ